MKNGLWKRLSLTVALAGLAAVVMAPDGAMATVPGLSGTIAFTGSPSGTLQIYTVEPDGSTLTRLTTDSSNDQSPAWSPDGTRIAFSSDRDGDQEIFVMNADGSNQTQLTNNAANDAFPTWSPDGSQIAFSSNRDGDSEIFAMNADGSNQTQLTTNAAYDARPDWSADGATIAFDSDRDGNFNVYLMAANGSGQTQLTADPADEFDPAFAPDSSRIAFTSGRYDSCNQIVTIKPDGTGEKKANGFGRCDEKTPAFSPSGTLLVWAAYGTSNSLYTGPSGLGDPTLPIHQITPEHDYYEPDWQSTNSRLSLTASASSIGVGDPISLTGRLTVSSGSPVGKTIALFAKAPGGSLQQVASHLTGSQGAYAFNYVPKAIGSWTFEVRYAGDGTLLPANRARDVDVHGHRGKVSLTLSSARITFGHSVTATAHLYGWHTNRVVTIYTMVSGVKTVIAEQSVGPRGNLAVTLHPSQNTAVWASWSGDDWYTADLTGRAIAVRVAISAQQTGFYAISGLYHLYHYHSSCPASHVGCPHYSISVRPNHAGQIVGFTIQEATSAGWLSAAGGGVKLRSNSTAAFAIVYGGRSFIGHHFRIMASFRSDGDHWGARTPWRYFTITP